MPDIFTSDKHSINISPCLLTVEEMQIVLFPLSKENNNLNLEDI